MNPAGVRRTTGFSIPFPKESRSCLTIRSCLIWKSTSRTLATLRLAKTTFVDRTNSRFFALGDFRSPAPTFYRRVLIHRSFITFLLGPPGVGKTHLAAGLGVKAAQNGFTVAFLSTDRLLDALKRDGTPERKRVSRGRHMVASLLVIDEMGFQAMDRADAHRFFQIINHRYERASTIITSNKGVREWPEVLAGDEVLATAILDRFLHHCHVVQIDGRSYRLKDLDLQLGGKSKRTKQK